MLTGLLALVGVALAVGLVLGGFALAGTRVLGVGGAQSTAKATSQQSIYLPEPQPTGSPSGPLVTLAPGDDTTFSSDPSLSVSPSASESPAEGISLSSGQTSATAMQRVDLSGVYTGGEGAILQVQRFAGGGWTDFPVTVPVRGETFATYVQTSQAGVNRFRVIDTDTGVTSNEIEVTIG